MRNVAILQSCWYPLLQLLTHSLHVFLAAADQIRKSEKNLLEKLFTVIHKLTPEQMESLLKEEDTVVQRRQVARKMFEDVKSAVFQVRGREREAEGEGAAGGGLTGREGEGEGDEVRGWLTDEQV